MGSPTATMNHEASALLAHTVHGHIKMCPTGCVHLTFDGATLHFPCSDEFEAMAQAVALEADAAGPDEAFDVRHGWFSMSLTAMGSREFTRLVLEAIANLAWRRGDYEFTDEDLSSIRRAFAS